MFLDESEEFDLRKKNAVTNTEFLQKIFGDAHTRFQGEGMLSIQFLSCHDLVEILMAASHELLEAVALLTEPMCDDRFLTEGQLSVIDYIAQRVRPFLQDGHVDAAQVRSDHRSSKSATEEVSFTGVARSNAFANHQD